MGQISTDQELGKDVIPRIPEEHVETGQDLSRIPDRDHPTDHQVFCNVQTGRGPHAGQELDKEGPEWISRRVSSQSAGQTLRI